LPQGGRKKAYFNRGVVDRGKVYTVTKLGGRMGKKQGGRDFTDNPYRSRPHQQLEKDVQLLRAKRKI